MATPPEPSAVQKLEEELARKNEEVRVLRQVFSEVNATLRLEDIYEIILSTMDDLFGFHHALIFLLDDSSQILRVVASRGYQDPAIGATVPLGVGVIGIVAQRRKMMRVGNLGQSRSYAAAVRSEMAHSAQFAQLGEVPTLPGLPDAESQIAIPLLIKDRLVGVFAVESAEQKVFSERDETLVSIVANLSASAMHNALLYRQEEENSQSLAEKVKERTRELEQKNQALEQTLLELKDTQNQLVIREKMASLGTLVGGLAHEINTPLGVVNSNSDTMVHTVERLQSLLAAGAPGQAEPPGKVRQFLESIRSLAEFNKTAAQRMIGIMASLRTFARLDRALEDEVDIHEGLASVLTLLEHQTKDRITIHTDYSPVPRLICFPSQVNQMFMNLLLNAMQAIQGKGDVYLKTYTRDHGLVVEIRDNGAGIAPENLNRVFDPGFTTKGVKVGTGLGLSIVRRILDEHDGSIEVQSKVGKGSTFRVFLPLRKKTQGG